MDDLSSHFFTIVGQLLDQAAVGRLRVRLELSDGAVADGVPSGDFEGRELDDTGYQRCASIDGQAVALDRVRYLTVFHPGDVGAHGADA
jgi:hypothetical protein